MKRNRNESVDKLSNVGALLLEIEAEYVENEDGSSNSAREALVGALTQYHNSRFAFGKALAAYKVFFVKDGSWVAAAGVIGEAIHSDEKTIYRIVKDYQRASKVPAEALKELEALGIDPAEKKNEAAISNLIMMDPPAVQADPKKAVAVAVKKMYAVKAEKKAKTPKKPRPATVITGDTEIVNSSHEEKRRLEIRMKIRAALENVSNDKKLDELIAAIDVEMFETWGLKEPVSVIFTPRASALTPDGLQREDAA